MLLFPHPLTISEYHETIQQIIVLSEVLRRMPVTADRQQAIFHQQLLKSSLFSARIEGNQLTLPEATTAKLSGSRQKSHREINNVMRALRSLPSLSPPITLLSLLAIHAAVMHELSPQAGKIRVEDSAIYDQWGNVVYLAPAPAEVQSMLAVWLDELNRNLSTEEQLLQLVRTHYYLEKIHPFLDGNGRTGRIILQWQLRQTKLFGDYVLPIDEYLEKYRHDYYTHLEKNSRHCADMAHFMLEGIRWSLEAILHDVEYPAANHTSSAANNLTILLPRRQEIVAIVQDHPYCSLDMIARRFPTVSTRTIAYDVNYLVSQGYLVKMGATRGVRYSIGTTEQ
jgi:Fic family protein